MAEILEYKCPNCGGTLKFNPNSQNVTCPYCSSEFTVDSLLQYDQLLQDSNKDDSFSWKYDNRDFTSEELQQLHSYLCENCGGEIITDASTAATSCPYCNSPVVVKENLGGGMKPDCLIPFKLDKQQAKDKFLKHLEKKPFLPKDFKSICRIDEIKGIYVPFFLYDGTADVKMSYRGMNTFTYVQGEYDITERRYYSIYRAGDISYQNVPSDASLKFSEELMESIEPFDYSQIQEFKTGYLTGYFADRYDVNNEKCAQVANDRIKNSAIQSFQSTIIGYQSLIPVGNNVIVENGNVKYALLPVWLLNTTYNNKQYTFAMNGQTGKFVGDLPVDKTTGIKYFILVFLAVALVLFGILCFINRGALV